MKQNKLIIILLSLIFLANFPLKASAETVLQKIERTGVIDAGARKDAVPFGYIDKDKKWTGYSVELLKIIQHQLEAKLKKPLKLNLQQVTIDNRFQVIQENKVDIVCGADTMTQERLELVNFSIPYFMTGSQFLIKFSDAKTLNIGGTLANIPIAFIPGTTTDIIIRQIYPYANWKPVKNRQEGIEKLKKGEVKLVASDGILLIGELVRLGNNPKQFVLTPNQPLTTELYGCMLPKNDPEWKKIVDTAISSEDNQKLQDQWFNLKKGDFPYPLRVFP